MTTTTKTSALDALDRLDEAAIRVGRRRQEVEDALTVLGRRGRPQSIAEGRPATRASGRIGELGAQVRDELGRAAREGEDGEVGAIEAQIATLEREADSLRGELDALAVEERRIQAERVAVLHSGHADFAASQRAVAAAGDELRTALAAAARAVLDHQPQVQRAARLAATGLDSDAAARQRYLARCEPWLGRTTTAAEYWRAIERTATQVEA